MGACWGPAMAGKVEEPFGSVAESWAAFQLPPQDLPSEKYRKSLLTDQNNKPVSLRA